MQLNRKSLASLVTACTLLTLSLVAYVQAEDKKVDPTGTWTWTTPGTNGGADRKNTLTLKLQGNSLTGILSYPSRQNGEVRDTPIEEGQVKGDEITFNVSREFGGTKVVSKYKGTISGDSIKGKIDSVRNGENQSRDWDAKREPK